MDVLYYLDWDGSVDPPIVNYDWFRNVRRGKNKMRCRCGAVRPESYGQPVNTPIDNMPQEPTYPSPMALIIRRDLLDVISPHLEGHVVGSCVWAQSGEAIPEFATVYTVAPKSVYLRGDAKTTYRICEQCGMPRLGSDPRSNQPLYIARSQLSGRQAYQMTVFDSIVVSGDLRQRIAEAGFAGEWHPYPVYDKPIDGRSFPGDE